MGRNIMQIVWIPYELVPKVVAKANEWGLALNKTITRIVEEYFKGEERVRVEERVTTVTIKLLVCPVCLKEFKDIKALIEHLRGAPRCWEELRLMVGR